MNTSGLNPTPPSCSYLSAQPLWHPTTPLVVIGLYILKFLVPRICDATETIGKEQQSKGIIDVTKQAGRVTQHLYVIVPTETKGR